MDARTDTDEARRWTQVLFPCERVRPAREIDLRMLPSTSLPAMAMTPSDARIALACLDLTSLGVDDTPAVAAALARSAHTPYGTPSTICVYPELLLATRMSLMREGIPQVRVATVINFPDGGSDADRAERETRRAVAVGADEIELMFPWRAFLTGDRAAAQSVVARTKALCGKAELKVILETPRFAELSQLRMAADCAISAGADFLATSTGDSGTPVTADAARCLGAAIAAVRRPIGLKISASVRTLAEAGMWIAIAAEIHGRERVVPARFRIGAQALLEELLPALAAEPVDEE